MSDKKYYWIKLKTDFFDQDKIDFLMGQDNGAKYVVIYQMLMLKTAQQGGLLATKTSELMIPYDIKKIVRDTKYFDFDTVTVALELFKKLGLIYEEENHILKLADAEKLVGSEWSSAERVRKYRNSQKALQCNTYVTKSNAQCNTDIDIEKEINTDINTDINKDIYLHEAKQVIFMQLPLNTNELYPIYENDIKEYKELYPNVDVEQQIRCMKGWLDANPKNRKTKNGIKRFINGWLSREQDKPRNKNYNTEQIKAAQPTYDDSNNIQVSQEEVDAFFRDRHRNL